MGQKPSPRTVGRTAAVAPWLLVLALAGRPAWAGVLLGLVLVAVWASPYLLASNRRPAGHRAVAQPQRGTVSRPS